MRTHIAYLRRLIVVVAQQLILALICANAQQLQLTLNVSSRPNPYISMWESKRETAVLTVMNGGTTAVAARMHARILLDGTIQAETNSDEMPVLNIETGVTLYFAEEILPLTSVIFHGSGKRAAQRTGMLPAGTYELCVELLSPAGSRLSQTVCKRFFVTDFQNPTLLSPIEDRKISHPDRPLFRWTPVMPAPPGSVIYRLLLFEVLPGQYPMQAFRANMPVIDMDVRGRTQLIWPAEYMLPTESTNYVWTIQTLDENRNPVGEKDGYSEPGFFTYRMTNNEE